jgi:thioredoxin 1
MENTSSQGRKPTGLRKRLLFIIGLIVVVAAVLVVKGQRQVSNPPQNGPERRSAESNRSRQPTTKKSSRLGQPQPAALPRLIDLGADKCIPCKMMAPILEELKEEYKGVFKVEFIDVWKNPQPGRQYKIRVIPTQIFIDGSGKELYRHEGFFSKEDILKKWKELGVDVERQVGLSNEQRSEIKPAFMRVCCEKPKTRIPGWGKFRP